VSLSYRKASTAPVTSYPPKGQNERTLAHGNVADPVFQNFCITAVVIGVAITAVFLVVVVRLAQHYRTLDTHQIHELRG
jgi:multicomponent Na+:H+ antiporter subunit C